MERVFKQLAIILLLASMLLTSQSCNHNKIACPTYADSMPQKKSKKKSNKPDIPKPTKPKSGVLPKGYGKK